jgi:hypothetical protein
MQQAAQWTQKSKINTTVRGLAIAMSSIRTHAPGATPGGMYLDHIFVAQGGGGIIVGITTVSMASSTLLPYLFDVKNEY